MRFVRPNFRKQSNTLKKNVNCFLILECIIRDDASRVAPSNLFEGDAGALGRRLEWLQPRTGLMISHNGIHRMQSIERSEVGIPGFLQVLYSTIQA